MYLVAVDGITLYNCNGVKLDAGAYFHGKPRYDLYKNSITTQDRKLNKKIKKVNKRCNKLEKKMEKARVKINGVKKIIFIFLLKMGQWNFLMMQMY